MTPKKNSLNAMPPLNKARWRRMGFGSPLLLFFFAFFAEANEYKQENVFRGLREGAKPIENLSSFLRMYMGDCEAGAEAASCRQQSAAFRQQTNQRSHIFVVFEDAIELEIRSVSGEQFSISWLPFFSAFGYGLSAQAPKQWSKEGHPIYSYMRFRGQLPPGTPMDEILRWHKLGRLAAEVIVVPQGTWKAASKGKASLEGMKVSWKAIRIFDSRSGQTLGIWVN